MKTFLRKVGVGLTTLATVAMVSPQSTWASNHGQEHHASSHGTGGSSTPKAMNSSVIAAPNGNTGFTGIGLPKALDADKHKHDHHDSDLTIGGVKLPKDVKAAPNGNTGFTGLGVPGGNSKSTTSFTATSGSSLGVFASTGSSSLAKFNRAATLAGDKAVNLKTTQLIGRNDDGSNTTTTGGRQTDGPTSSSDTPNASSNLPRPNHNNGGDRRDDGQIYLQYPALRTMEKQGLGVLADANLSGSGTPKAPNSSVTKLKTDTGTNLKPIVDQEVHIGPKLPGPQKTITIGSNATANNETALTAKSPLLVGTKNDRLGVFATGNLPKVEPNVNEMKTDLKANAPFRDHSLKAPSIQVTKLTTDAGLNVKPLVNQEVHVGPKLPGPLGASKLNLPATALPKVEPTVRTTHTAGFDLGPFDPTGGVINAGLELGEAALGVGGGGDAAAAGAATSGGAAAGGAGIGIGWGTGVTLSGPAILGGLPGSPLDVARAVAANSAAAAAHAAQSTVGTGLLLFGAGGGPVLLTLGPNIMGVTQSIYQYEHGTTTLGDPGIGGRNKPGGYYQGDARSKQVDGPIGKKKQSLSGNGPQSLTDVAINAAAKVADAASAAQQNQQPTQLKVGTLSGTFGKPATKLDSVPTQTLPGGPIADSKSSSTTSSAKTNRSSPLGSLLNGLSTALGSPADGSGSAGGTSDGGAADNASAATNSVTADSTTFASSTAGTNAASGADLVLEDITLSSPATQVAGPAYTVKFRNQGTQAAGKFQVAVLAGLEGILSEDAPRAVIEVPALAAGEAKDVTLRLPKSALRIAETDGNSAAFTHLFVAVDLMNTVAETDETNNTAVVERTALEPTEK